MDMPLIPELPDCKADAKIGLLGGSFNPPHLGHAFLALSVLSMTEIDQLWVLPCADHPFGKELAPFAARMRMCEMAYGDLKRVSVLDLEKRLPTPSYTVQTLRAIKEARPGLKLSYVIGSDLMHEIESWHEPEELKRLCDFVFFEREGYASPEGAAPKTLGIRIPNISSSAIRESGELEPVHPEVARLIRIQGLYGLGSKMEDS